MTLKVVLEVAPKRSFASALDWPGWSRGARTPDEALEAMLAYAPRYAVVARRAKVTFRPPATARAAEVVERLAGGGGTEFDVPGVDVKKPWGPRYAARRSAWHALDHAWEIEDRSAP